MPRSTAAATRVTRTGAAGTRAAAIVATVLVATLAAGCTASDTASSPGMPVPTTTATAAPTPVDDDAGPLPDVPVRSADLAAHTARAATSAPTPTRLRVDALGIDIPLDAVGVAADGQMEIPAAAERGGWYRFGAAPGDTTGTVVIAAHVDSVASAGLGPFARLVDARPGQRVVVDLTDGTQVAYEVAAAAAVAKPDVAWSEVFVRDGPTRLVLVTCGGAFRQDVRSYSDNVLVTATPVDA